jgi:hypothetical protein
MIGQERLLELLRYGPETGNLYWRIRPLTVFRLATLQAPFLKAILLSELRGKLIKRTELYGV